MRWLNPTLVYFAALAAVPLLLHLLMRERVRRVPFTAVRFLRQQGRQALTRRRWVEWLLTAVRAACVLVLVVAFARPFFPSGETGAPEGERELVVVLLDTSRSMSYGSRFDEARAAAEEVIRSAGDGKALQVVTFAQEGNVSIADPQDSREAVELVRRARPSAFGTDILAALDRVFAAIGSRGAGGEVHLVSDLQVAGIPRNREVRPLPRGFAFHVHAVGGEAAPEGIAVAGNAFSTEVTPEPNNASVSARITNRGKSREVEAQLVVDGKPLASRRVLLPQNGEAVATLTGTVQEVGEHPGMVLVKGAPAALKDDDRLFFALRVVNRIRVAVVDGSPSAVPEDDAAFYLVRALNAGKDTPLEAAAHPSLPPLKGVDVVVLAGAGSLPQADLERLEDFVRGGGGLLISVGPGIEPEPFNATIGRLAPAHLRRWVPSDRGSFLAAMDARHPLVQRVAAEGGDLTTARFRGSCELKDTQDARVVIRLDEGRPALVEKHLGEGTVMLFAAALDRRGGDFPLRAIFVPFIRECVTLLSARSERSSSLALGETLPVPAGGTVECPDGASIGGEAGQGATWVVSQPGFYHIKGKDRTELFAANVDPAESDLTAAAASDIEGLFSAARDWVVRRTARGYELVLAAGGKLKAERRWNIGWWALVALVGLCAVELWLSQVASRK